MHGLPFLHAQERHTREDRKHQSWVTPPRTFDLASIAARSARRLVAPTRRAHDTTSGVPGPSQQEGTEHPGSRHGTFTSTDKVPYTNDVTPPQKFGSPLPYPALSPPPTANPSNDTSLE